VLGSKREHSFSKTKFRYLKIIHSDLIEQAIDSPWKLWNEVVRFLLYPIARLQFALAGIEWGKGWKIYGLPILQITRGSKVSIGDNLQLRSTKSSNPLSPFHPVVISTRSSRAQLKIGSDFSMTGGSIVANKKIQISDRVMVGANCLIIDTDFHPLDSKERHQKISTGKSNSIKIEKDVFIGTQAIVLKGSVIKSGSVVGAKSLVTKKFKTKKIIIGNPAK